MGISFRRLANHLDRVQQMSNTGSWEWDIVTNDLMWSPHIFRIFGLAPDAFEPTYPRFLERVFPEDRILVEEGVRRAIEGIEPYETRYVRIYSAFSAYRTVVADERSAWRSLQILNQAGHLQPTDWLRVREAYEQAVETNTIIDDYLTNPKSFVRRFPEPSRELKAAAAELMQGPMVKMYCAPFIG
jgi:hypothetical protein